MDRHGNVLAVEGCTRCACGAKYWEKDVCASCGEPYRFPRTPEEAQECRHGNLVWFGNECGLC